MSSQEHVAVITGATSGIGLDAATRLARRGGTVVLAARNEERGRPAVDRVRTASGNPDVHLVTADLGRFAEVRRMAEEIRKRWPRIDVLVNNAGLALKGLTITEDGFETTQQVNHLSPFLLTHMLREPLRAGGARVVNVSSKAHHRGDLRRRPVEEILRGPEDYSTIQAYSDSKLANVLFTVELARREGTHGVTANALHPGVLATGIWDRNRGVAFGIIRMLKPFMGRPSAGGEAVEALAVDLGHAGTTGRYFDQLQEARPSRQARDAALAAELWEVSARATGVAERS